MKLHCLHITLLFTFFTLRLVAQLSPGDLSKAHAELEGIRNCTKCHILGKKVSNDKCLDCHDEIESRMNLGKGYHASAEVQRKDCAFCHSDHHGRNFDMVRFDEEAFEHELTGYILEGAHEIIDCRQCHKPDFVEDRELKKRPSTFLGLNQECVSCHEDYHQSTLSKDCAQCHDSKKFFPASRFEHNHTEFALLGEHQTLECIDCHQKETRNGQNFQRFANIPFNNCNSCHEDAHESRLGENCKECHTEQSFTALSGLRNFNHSITDFPLKGRHQSLDCNECHNLNATPLTVFDDRPGVQTNDCATCHADVHENKFGNNCVECHNERSFRTSASLKNFNHTLTGFELAGKHQGVDCKQCHKTSFIEPLRHNVCVACHEDYHNNQFATVNNGEMSPDCASCHIVDGFEFTTYSIADHNRSKFPLAGAHAATPCFVCHKAENEWRFRNIGANCIDCHENIHGNEIEQKYYPNQSCDRCHNSTTWDDNHFDHSLTSFQLAGVHRKQKCSACHVPDQEQKTRKFRNTPSACATCHDDEHRRQFDTNGETDCKRCHSFDYWKINRFNHNRTAFKLTGKHVKVACEACHQEMEVNGETFVQYKFETSACVDCHQ